MDTARGLLSTPALTTVGKRRQFYGTCGKSFNEPGASDVSGCLVIQFALPCLMPAPRPEWHLT